MSEQEPEESAKPVFQTRIFIEKDGTVVFENLAEELLPLVRELDPDSELGLACRLPAGEGANGTGRQQGGQG